MQAEYKDRGCRMKTAQGERQAQRSLVIEQWRLLFLRARSRSELLTESEIRMQPSGEIRSQERRMGVRVSRCRGRMGGKREKLAWIVRKMIRRVMKAGFVKE